MTDIEQQLRSEIEVARNILGASPNETLKQAAERVEVNCAERAREQAAARGRVVTLESALRSVTGVDHERCVDCDRPIATDEDSLNPELNPDLGDGTDALCWRRWYIDDRCQGKPGCRPQEHADWDPSKDRP